MQIQKGQIYLATQILSSEPLYPSSLECTWWISMTSIGPWHLTFQTLLPHPSQGLKETGQGSSSSPSSSFLIPISLQLWKLRPNSFKWIKQKADSDFWSILFSSFIALVINAEGRAKIHGILAAPFHSGIYCKYPVSCSFQKRLA